MANRRVGLALAENKLLPQILEELGHVAEGVYTAREVDGLARSLGVDMPISAAVAAILDGRVSAGEALELLDGTGMQIALFQAKGGE